MAKKNQYDEYAYLDRLSMEQLEEILRKDTISPDRENEAAIFHILEVMEQREKDSPAGQLPDVDQAWAEFKQYYCIPEGDGKSLYPPGPIDRSEDTSLTSIKKVPRPRKMLVAAAILVALFGGMITAQAVGIDIIGAIGRWTEATFHFEIFSNPNKQDVSAFQELAAEYEIPLEFIPTWSPEGFEGDEPWADHVENYSTSIFRLYRNNETGQYYSVIIEKYYDESYIENVLIEKDEIGVECYTREEKQFYIFPNLDSITAIWSDGVFFETITGQLQIDEMKEIINSIGG